MSYRVFVRIFALCAGVLLAVPPVGLDAQLPQADPGGSVRSRADLEELLEFYDQILASPAYSESAKASTRANAERIRERLSEGDFRLGDRIVLLVQGEPTLPDTLLVLSGPKVTLPLFGDIPLNGVLRSEISDHLQEALSQFIRNPVVQAQGLMRISIQGAVGLPGFYVVPADGLLSQTLMVAGGMSQTSDIRELKIERGADVVLEGDELQEALRQGLTLDQLNLQAGDQLVLPVQQTGGGILANVSMILGLVTAVALIVVQVGG